MKAKATLKKLIGAFVVIFLIASAKQVVAELNLTQAKNKEPNTLNKKSHIVFLKSCFLHLTWIPRGFQN